jgi:GTP cyclohydrolase I
MSDKKARPGSPAVHSAHSLPDVAAELSRGPFTPLEWVGMRNIPSQVRIHSGGQELLISCKLHAEVSLDRGKSRGIHMSRLFEILEAQVSLKSLSWVSLETAANDFLQSHQDLSSRARLEVDFLLPLKRETLKSKRATQRFFPFRLSVLKDVRKGARYFIKTKVDYSSTCPASLALARALNSEKFFKHFATEQITREEAAEWLRSSAISLATPHAQRSLAEVKIQVKPSFDFQKTPLIVEESLQTTVQTLVKRSDEQEFARLNGENPMFCEDAARRVSARFKENPDILYFYGRFSHLESLHPHDAVAEARWKRSGI